MRFDMLACLMPALLFVACTDGAGPEEGDPNGGPGGGKADGPGAGCARLTVQALDIWAQPLAAPSVRLGGSAAHVVDLCAPRAVEVAVEAPRHHPFAGTLAWQDGVVAVARSNAGADAAWMLTRDGAEWTLWVGLAHRWFAASGRPARHGNDVRLLMDGEEAWQAVAADLDRARSLVTGSTWWWTSDVELVRDASRHVTSTLREREENTVMARLDKLAAAKKIMVGQFVGQDGLFSNITVDDALLAHAETAGDRFEYMGEANPAAGDFEVRLPPVDFATRVEDGFAPNGSYAGDVGLAPFVGPIAVAASDIPLVSGFDLPVASWHQKFWTIDQRVAFIGGMNAKTTDWDTSEHRVFEPRRMRLDASTDARRAVAEKRAEPDFGPRKDYMVRVAGPSAIDAAEVFHARWEEQRQGDNEYASQASPFTLGDTPAEVAAGVQLQVIATMPAPHSEYAILETLLRAIGEAEDFIYIEDQYFRAPLLYDAIEARMQAVPALVLVVVTKPVSEWIDPGCWQTALAYERFTSRFPNRFRIYRMRAFDWVRTDCTLCRDETEAHFVDIDVHSKIVIIDDTYLEVGSCNSNNRGLLYEGELSVAVVDEAWVGAARRRIFGNLLGPSQRGDMAAHEILGRFDALADKNQSAFARWDAEGMDIDLDGAPLPAGLEPEGFLYPLVFGPPEDYLLEDVGADAT